MTRETMLGRESNDFFLTIVSLGLRRSSAATPASILRHLGVWDVTLPASPAGDSFSIKIAAGDTIIPLSNVIRGDVYVCSGTPHPRSTVFGVQRQLQHLK